MSPIHTLPRLSTHQLSPSHDRIHSPRRRNLSWSGSLLNLLRATPSLHFNEDQTLSGSHPRPSTPVTRSKSELLEIPRSPRSSTNRSPNTSRSNLMPVAPYPCYAPPEHSPYIGSVSARSKRRLYRSSTPAPSDWGGHQYCANRSHSKSASASNLQLPFSVDHLAVQPSPLRHRRSRSDSFSFSSRTSHRMTQYPLPMSFSQRDVSGSIRGHSHSRSASFYQARSIRPRRSSMRSPNTDGFGLEHLQLEEPRRVRFIVPAILHRYLSDPPFRISIKRPPPPNLPDYYHPYLSHAATRPTVSFLLITTPYLPWSIRLGAEPLSMFPSSEYHTVPLAYLSVHDVLHGIYTALRKPVTLDDYKSLALNREFHEEVVTAYRKRKAQETCGLPGVQETMRRIDWLVGRTTFEGLERSEEGEGVWRLKLGWNQKV